MIKRDGPFSASFLWETVGTWDLFIPEELTNEQKELATLARNFLKNEVEPVREKIESKEDPTLVPKLLKKAGELGLLMAEVPEAYGGLGLDKITATVIAENATGWSSFIVPLMCHTGIGTLPILYYGTEAQKQKYLPKLATGEFIGAYALTEANSGSDALAAKTRAVLSPDKKFYILNGEKQFITNGGFADLFTVFAKVDGDKFTAFLIERNFPGLSIGKEEKKMGIHGSSTVPLILQDCKVPVENVLGEVGKGHHIAFNVLNVGRWKLGAACMGSAKRLLEYSSKYIKERQQFGKPLAAFQALREKLANDAIRTYLLESVIYSYASSLDTAVATIDKTNPDYYKLLVKKIKGLNIEASIAKVFGSEVLSYISDDAVQMYGGYGFIADYPPEQFYRDSRINRIYEGTNEINRLLIPDTLMRRAMKGSIDLMGAIQNVLAGLKGGYPKTDATKPLAVWIDQLDSLKRLTIYFAGVTAQKYMEKLKEKETLVMLLADLVIEVYAMGCGLERALKIRRTLGEARSKLPEQMTIAYISEKTPELLARVRQGLFNVADGNETEFASYDKALTRLVQPLMASTESIKETVATRILEKESFAL
ncbi:MAG: acyl-CoA dehydrogenase family protein [Deltaproteobacteria bacterium]|nr:acyl-CoA dehydrogenase family protein [Deltaproteobacteria bacterium]